MLKFITITCFIFLFIAVHAQDCDKYTIMNTKGKWVTDADNIVSPEKTFPSSQYNQLRTRLDKIAELFKEAYPQPMGMQAKWYRSIRGNAIIANGPAPYQFNSLYQGWYCDQNLHKLMLGSQTATWAYAFVNDLHWFLNDQYDQLRVKIDGAIAYFLPRIKEQWKGFIVYEPSANQGKSKAILITRNNQLPYKPVSRSVYLQALRQKIESDKQRQPKAQPKYFDDKLKIIDDISKSMGQDELQQAAILDNDVSFKGFSSLEKGGRMVVVINPGYFDTRLPRWASQVIMLYWQWDNSLPSQNFKKELEENFPIDKLKQMIDK